MSLDVTLTIPGQTIKKVSSGIFIREDGQTKEITIEEWNAKNPDREPVKLPEQEYETNEVFSANITHNLGKMALAAELYQYLWRPDELNITKALQLIVPLSKGLETLLEKPEHYKTFNPENGWGSYDGLLRFVSNYLKACIEYPEADIEADR